MIKKLDFSNIEIYVNDNLINPTDIIWKDFYEVDTKKMEKLVLNVILYIIEKKRFLYS